MSIDETRKKFVIKHVFKDVNKLSPREFIREPEKSRFNVPWRLQVYKHANPADSLTSGIACIKSIETNEWSIETAIEAKVFTKTGVEIVKKNRIYTNVNTGTSEALVQEGSLENYLIDGNFTIECHVTINKMTGIEIPIEMRMFRSFDDESAKELSDVVLVVDGEKFYGSKVYLATQSSYFKSLLCGNFDESKQSEIELKDIDPHDFQKFLEALYGEPIINDDNIEGILQLADMYDAKTVIRQCEFFYLRVSQQDLKSKFNMALKYNMKELRKECLLKLKSVDDIRAIVPEDNDYLDKETFRQLLNMSMEFQEKK